MSWNKKKEKENADLPVIQLAIFLFKRLLFIFLMQSIDYMHVENEASLYIRNVQGITSLTFELLTSEFLHVFRIFFFRFTAKYR